MLTEGNTWTEPETAPPVEKLTPALETESAQDQLHMEGLPLLIDSGLQLKDGGAGGGGGDAGGGLAGGGEAGGGAGGRGATQFADWKDPNDCSIPAVVQSKVGFVT